MLKLVDLRKEKGLTQKALADQIGVKFKNVGAWEQGRSEPRISDIIALSNVLECTTDELLGRTDYGTGVVQVQGESLTAEERKILNCYRALDVDGKAALYQFLTKFVTPQRKVFIS